MNFLSKNLNQNLKRKAEKEKKAREKLTKREKITFD